MTEGTVKTQGTRLYTADAISSSVAAVLKMACPTGISGLGGAKSQIDKTCLDDLVDMQYDAGLGQPGQVTVPFNFIPTHTSHQILFDLKESGETLQWMECFSESQTAPTLDSNDELVAPDDCTTAEFRAYIADVNIDAATNDIVRGTLLLQRSGPVIWHWNADAP